MQPSLGDLVRESRRSKKWTQEKLADEARISVETIYRIEKGITKKPQDAILKELAAALGIGFDELQEACRHENASAALQAATVAPDTAATISPPAAPPDTTQPATPPVPARTQQRPNQRFVRFRTGRSKRIARYVAVALALVMLAALALSIPSLIQRITTATVTISDTVLCLDNERVVGVWVSAVQGNSNFADPYKINSNGSEVRFSYHLTYDLSQGGAYNLHVGCGGSKQDWEYINKTENGSGMVKDHAPHFFTCRDLPLVTGAGSCWLKG